MRPLFFVAAVLGLLAGALGAADDPDAVLKKEDAGTVRAWAHAPDSSAYVPVLQPWLKDGRHSEEMLEAAFEVLKAAGEKSAPCAQGVAEILRTAGPDQGGLQWSAARALSAMGPDGLAEAAKIVDAATPAKMQVVVALGQGFGPRGAPLVPALGKLLHAHHGDANARRMLLAALHEIHAGLDPVAADLTALEDAPANPDDGLDPVDILVLGMQDFEAHRADFLRWLKDPRRDESDCVSAGAMALAPDADLVAVLLERMRRMLQRPSANGYNFPVLNTVSMFEGLRTPLARPFLKDLLDGKQEIPQDEFDGSEHPLAEALRALARSGASYAEIKPYAEAAWKSGFVKRQAAAAEALLFCASSDDLAAWKEPLRACLLGQKEQTVAMKQKKDPRREELEARIQTAN